MYSTGAFAKLTDVTVKALRHYERVGLLAPRRTSARYRRYALGDLQRLERILALKSLGLSLKAIKTLLKRGPVRLRAHRESLEQKRARLVVAPETIDAWSRRADWPSGLRTYVASCYAMEPADWERVVAFIEHHGCR